MERQLGDGTRITRRNILKGAAALGAGVGFIGPWRRARAQGKKAILIGLTCDATGTFALPARPVAHLGARSGR